MDSRVKICELAIRMKDILGLGYSPVGVRFLDKKENTKTCDNIKGNIKMRYCQGIMLARKGMNVVLENENISCPAAAHAFGFRPLPDGLANGHGLVGFGIVSDPKVGKKMFENMPKLTNKIEQIQLFPLEKTEHMPDVIVVEDYVEKLMWLVLAYLHVTGGSRVNSSTAVLQATCVDATISPFIYNKMNLSYGCYGCRDATDIETGETILGFPTSLLYPIMEHLEYLHKKAIPSSRAKNAYKSMLKNKTNDMTNDKEQNK